MFSFTSLLSLALATSTVLPSANAWTVFKNHTGQNFFDDWTFFQGTDANFGNALYQPKAFAMANNLTSVNSAGRVIMKVDNTQTPNPGDTTFGRSSINVQTSYTVNQNSMIIMDAVHMPFGCSVWPAFWTNGTGTWPNHGEIDIVENVNLATTNAHALHTLDGCKHPGDGVLTANQQVGKTISTDCFNVTNNNQGCVVQDNTDKSYGSGFAAAGGGVYATLWNDEGIRIWFFPRGSIPADLPTSNPQPGSWSAPQAFYPSSTCDVSKFFQAQTIIFNIQICGAFAGQKDVFAATCSARGAECQTLVADPSNYNDAYFEVNYVSVLTGAPTNISNPSSGSGSSNGGSGSGSNSTGGSGGRSGTGSASAVEILGWPVAAVTAFGMAAASFLL